MQLYRREQGLSFQFQMQLILHLYHQAQKLQLGFESIKSSILPKAQLAID